MDPQPHAPIPGSQLTLGGSKVLKNESHGTFSVMKALAFLSSPPLVLTRFFTCT